MDKYTLVYRVNKITFSFKNESLCFLKEKVKFFKMDEWFLFNKEGILIRSSANGYKFL